MIAAFRSAGLVAALLLVTACAGPRHHWMRPATTAQQFSRDSYECAHQARQSVFRAGPPGFMYGGSAESRTVNKDLYRTCLQARGYERIEGGTFVGLRD